MVFGVTHRAGHLPTLMRLMLFESLQSGAPVFITSDFAASKVEQGTFIHKNITPPSFDRAQMSRGLQTFRDELEKYIRTTHQHKNYIAFVIPAAT